MDFIDLNRSFAPIRKDEPANLELGRWGRPYSGWLSWAELNLRSRVVILAEASSGKTEELKAQASTLLRNNEPAFFVRIEELADAGLSEAMQPEQAARLRPWLDSGSGDAFFFLDSVDETRLNRKSFEGALRRFARELGPALSRTKIVVTCRVSDWRGRADWQTIKEMLPPPKRLVKSEAEFDAEDALLAPIFGDAPSIESGTTRDSADATDEEILVVQLVPLDSAQMRGLAVHAGVPDVERFLKEIDRLGLASLASMPVCVQP